MIVGVMIIHDDDDEIIVRDDDDRVIVHGVDYFDAEEEEEDWDDSGCYDNT